MSQAFYVEPVGISGGLTIWWSNDVPISFSHISKNLVDGEVQLGFGGAKMKITWVYGDSVYSRITLNWNRLRGIGAHRNDPWIVLGDFNDISSHSEKVGGRRKDQRKIDGFNNLIEDIGIGDLGYKG